jgi:hypothetical protein
MDVSVGCVKEIQQIKAAQLGNGDGAPPEYRRASGFEQVKAFCESFADTMSPSYISGGNDGTINGSLGELNRTVGSWAGHKRAYDQCMTGHGYVHN